MATTKEQEILQIAENKIREGGYNNFSFREIATEIGIKSASVHYHFATKADLGAAVAENYTQRFMEQLGSVEDLLAVGINPINHYINIFQRALTDDKKMCLCGVLGAESDALPEKVVLQTRQFFRQNIEWLEDAYRRSYDLDVEQAKQKAITALATLEGAMMVSIGLARADAFELATHALFEN